MKKLQIVLVVFMSILCLIGCTQTSATPVSLSSLVTPGIATTSSGGTGGDVKVTKITVAATIAAELLIASGGWIFALFQQKANRKEKKREEQRVQKQKKIDRVNAYLDAYGELAELYRLFVRYEKHPTTDEEGNRAVEKQVLKPEYRFESAIGTLRETDIKGAIAQKIVAIRLQSGEVGDIIFEFDPTEEMNKRLGILYYTTVEAIEFWIEQKSPENMMKALQDSAVIRRKFRSDFSKAANEISEK